MGNTKYYLLKASSILLLILVLNSQLAAQSDLPRCDESPCLDVEFLYLFNNTNVIDYDGSPIPIPCEGTLRLIGVLLQGNSTFADWSYNSMVIDNDAGLDLTNTSNTGLYEIRYFADNGDMICGCHVEVVQATPPTISSTDEMGVSCNGDTDGSVTLTINGGSGSINYSWEDLNDNNNTEEGVLLNNQITNLEAGDYRISITDQLMCTSSVVTTISEPPLLQASISNIQHIICGEDGIPLPFGSATVSASGGTPDINGNYTYVWSTGNGDAIDNTLPEGSHNVIVMDVNGCTSTVPVEIMQNIEAPENVEAQVSGMIDCNGTSVILTGSSSSVGVSYHWEGPNGFTSIDNPLENITTPGDYILTVTRDDNNCKTDFPITVPGTEVPIPVITPNGSTLNCIQSSILLTAASSTGVSPFEYAWSNGADTDTTTIFNAGTYTVTITDNNGCDNTSSVMVGINTDAPTAAIAMPDTITCNNTIIELDASESEIVGMTAMYEWTVISANGNILNGGNTDMATVDAPGTYQVKITNNANGCADSLTVDVIQNKADPTATPDTLISCNVAGMGSFTLSNADAVVTGGQAGVTVTYHLSEAAAGSGDNPITQTPFNSQERIIYARVERTDNGCHAVSEVILELESLRLTTITFDPPLNADATLCGTSRIITVSPDSTLADYVYTWEVNNSDQNVNAGDACAALEITGNSNISLTYQLGECSQEATATVTLDNSTDTDAKVFQFANTNTLFCNINNFDSYQWGKESQTTLCPEPMEGETFPDVVIQDLNLDTYYYWVIVTEGDCSTKVYLNGEGNSPFFKPIVDPNIEYGDLALQVNPNPNNGAFELTITGDEVRDLELHLYDALGRAIYYQETPKIAGIETYYIAPPNLTQGLYFVRVTGNDNILLTEKIMVK